MQRQSKLDRSLGDELAALQAANDALADGRPLYRAGLNDDYRATLAPHFLLTNRRVLAVVNVGENDLDRIPELEEVVRAELTDAGEDVETIGMCVQLEAEAAAIEDPGERAEVLTGLGLGEGALFRMVRSAYHLLGLRTFLTTGDKESRAWTFLEGSTAPQCAGRIHTDFRARARPRRGDRLAGAARPRLLDQGQGGRQAPPRGQGLRRPRRRRDGVPLQRVVDVVDLDVARLRSPTMSLDGTFLEQLQALVGASLHELAVVVEGGDAAWIELVGDVGAFDPSCQRVGDAAVEVLPFEFAVTLRQRVEHGDESAANSGLRASSSVMARRGRVAWCVARDAVWCCASACGRQSSWCWW